MEEGMAGWQWRLFELQPHAMDGRSEDVIAVPFLAHHSVHRLLELTHLHTGRHLGDRGLKGAQVDVVGRPLLGIGCPTHTVRQMSAL